RIVLAFTPQVQHGIPKLLTHNDQGDFVLHGSRPVEPYPALGFEVTLTPRDFVVVGTWVEKDSTLGHRCFVTAAGPKPVQRLLVIRAGRLSAPVPLEGKAAEATAAARLRAPPLAYQAAM